MNKPTRRFIYGFFLMILGGFAVSLFIVEIRHGVSKDWLDWTLFAGSFLATAFGCYTVNQTTE